MRSIGGVNTAVKRPGSGRRRWAFAATAAVIIVSAVGFFVTQKKPDAAATGVAEADATESAQLVTAVAVAHREFARTAPISGEARPYRDVRVFAPAAGVRIAEVLVEIGDEVEEGQPLARLDADVVSAQVSEAEAGVREATIEAARTREEWERIDPIADVAALSAEEVATRRAAAESASARLAAQRAALAQISARTQGGFVRAPASGLVIERNARVGEFADQQALFRIVGGNRLEIAAQVAERDILSLHEGQVATFTASDGALVEATLRVAPVAVGQETRTGEALFDLPSDAKIRAGMYLRGEVVIETSSALAVPQTAITYASGEPSVFVIADGTARLKPVSVGAQSGGYVAIEGLDEGEMVAAGGGAFLLDGDSVRTVGPDAASAAAQSKAGG